MSQNVIDEEKISGRAIIDQLSKVSMDVGWWISCLFYKALVSGCSRDGIIWRTIFGKGPG
jgi:hypothetical protein